MCNEDEEVILVGNPLYNYMQEVGVQQLDEISIGRANGAATRVLQSSDFVLRAVVSEHVYRVLKLIFNSHLMFDDDSKFVSSCVPEAIVQSNRYRHGCIAATLAAALNAGVFLFNKYADSNLLKNLSVIPACLITFGSASYVSKLIFDNCQEQRVEKDLNNHIKILQNFYKLLQKIIRDIRDIDVMTRGSGLRSQPSEDHDHKIFVPLSKFRIAILTTLIKIGKTMSNGFMVLREQVPETVKQTDFATTSSRNLLPDNIHFSETKISVNDLNNMNHIYQLVQSEYLRWLALCYCPMQPRDEILTKKVCVKVVDSVHSVVLKCFFELTFQHVVNFCGRSDRRSVEKRKVAGVGHVDVLGVGVHSIMIHLVSLMEEVERLESSLRVVEEGRQSPIDSLKLFAVKFNEFKIKLQNANDHILKVDRDLKKQITTICSISAVKTSDEKRTKEHLSGTSGSASAFELTGKSDFSVHGEHEVFIGTSCNDTNMATDTGEECVFERRQLMPNVLNELKTALRPIYEMHAERERQALLRTGRSYLETVAEEESSVNASECSSVIKGTDEVTSPRLVNIKGAEAMLDNPCSNLVALCSTCIQAETGGNDSASRYDTANLAVSSSTGFPVNMNVSGSFSQTTGISSETHHYIETTGDTVINLQNYQPVSNSINMPSVAGTSTMLSTNRVFVPDSITSTSVIDADFSECYIAVTTESCIPKSPAVDIMESTLLADLWASPVADSSESTICLPLSAIEDNNEGATAHTVSVHPSPTSVDIAVSDNSPTSHSEIKLRSMGDIGQRHEIHKTLLSGIENLRMLSTQKILIEEEFVYDGDSESELTD